MIFSRTAPASPTASRPAATASAASPATASGRATSAAAATRRSAPAPQQDLKVDDAVGGNYYSVLRFDASFPLGMPEEYGVYGGVFADVGSLWGLDDTDGSMGDGRRRLPPALGGRRQPLRRHALRAAALQLRGAAPEGELRRRRAVPVLRPDPVLSGGGPEDRRRAGGGPGARRPRCRPAAARALPRAPRRRRRRPQPRLPLHQPGALLTGSQAGPGAPGRRGAPARRAAQRGARARPVLRGGGAPADRAAADAAARGVPQAQRRLRRAGGQGAARPGRARQRAGAAV